MRSWRRQTETLDMFQREWYRLQGEGKMSEVDMGTVPDIYLRNQQVRHRRFSAAGRTLLLTFP